MAKKITIGEWEKTIDGSGIAVVHWHGLELEIRTFVPFEEALAMSQEMVDMCYTEDGDYMPIMWEFARRAVMVDHMTNVTLPKDLRKQYELLMRSDLANMIWSAADMTQLREIEIAADMRINYLNAVAQMDHVAKLRELTSVSDKLIEKLDDLFMNQGASEMSDREVEDRVVKSYLREIQSERVTE